MKIKKSQVCWGIFIRKNEKFSGINRTPLVQCDTEETAKKMMHDVEFIYYNPKYTRNDYVIKKMTKEIDE